MDAEQEEFLSVLLTTTEEQQEAIAKAIKQFERENRALSVSVPMLRKSLEASLAEAMTETASTAKTAIDEALKPLLEQLTRNIEQTTERAADEKKQLNRAYALLGWKWFGLASVASVSVTALLLFGIYSAVWWQRHELESMRADAAEMEQNIARLEKLNGRIHLEMCGENKDKPCIKVDTKYAYGEDANSRYKYFALPK